MANKYLSIDDIFSAPDDTTYDEVEAWGGLLRIGSLTAGQMLKFHEANEDARTKKTATIRMVIDSLVDGNGRRIGNHNLIERFKEKNFAVINRIAAAILELNGFDEKALDFSDRVKAAKGDKEALAKLADRMRQTAEDIVACDGDEEKIADLVRGRKRAEAKNVSGEAAGSDSPTVSPSSSVA